MPNPTPQVKSVFAAALDFDSQEERRAYLDGACGNDPRLRQEVESLLAAHLNADGFLSQAVPNVDVVAMSPAPAAAPGTQIGPYKIREQIGEGGMGEVYVAEQERPVRRKVALKIIRPGMATKDVVARFEAERQALAMMDHPNIARVFDGGATNVDRSLRERDGTQSEPAALDPGQPYFVMELVQGVPITEYCDGVGSVRRTGPGTGYKHSNHGKTDTSAKVRFGETDLPGTGLPIRDRLELFLKVCRAVHHAHQKGIIHRDLKPSNILVAEIDGVAVPKVIDFGVAKAIDQKLTEQTVYTQFSQLVGTPLYMSPEQAGLGVIDIDTRSDVYSLGVLLYELLTGSTPFDHETLKRADHDELRRIIREEQPRRPSAMISTLAAADLSTVADRRGSDPRTLSSSLRGELDWLVMKALEKDRNRRYESAAALAEDVERYLADQPVLARPPSTAYRVRKFVRRNRALVASVSAVLVALTVGLALATTGFVTAARRLADMNKEQENNRVLIQLLSDFYPRPWGMQTLGRNHTVYDAVEKISPTLETRLENHPVVEIQVRQIFGEVYFAAGEYAKAIEHLEEALALAIEEYGEAHETVAEIHAVLADEVGWNYDSPHDYGEKLKHAEKAIAIFEGLGVESPYLVSAWFAKGHCLLLTSPERKEEAETAQRNCVDVGHRIGNVPVISLWDLGLMLMDFGDDRLDDAEAAFRAALANSEEDQAEPMSRATALSGLATCLLRKGDLPGAIETYAQSWELFRSDERLKSEARGFRVGFGLIETHFASGDIQEAFDALEQIEEQLTLESAPVESRVGALYLRGWLLFQLENYKGAAEWFRQSMELAENEIGDNNSPFAYACGYLAAAHEALGQIDQAARHFRRLIPMSQPYVDSAYVHDVKYWAYARATLGSADDEQELATALDAANRGLDFVSRWPWTWREAEFHHVIAGLQLRLGNRQAAIESLREGLKMAQQPHDTWRTTHRGVPSSRGDLELMLAGLYVEKGDVDQARDVLQEALHIRADSELGPDHFQLALAELRLGEFLVDLADHAAARQPLSDAYERLKPHPDVVNHLRRRAISGLVQVYQATNQPEQAAQWRAKVESLAPSNQENGTE